MKIKITSALAQLLGLILGLSAASSSLADETCMSPYMAKIVGQEDFIYVWTLGVEGVGDEQDKLVTISVTSHFANQQMMFKCNGKNTRSCPKGKYDSSL